VSTREAVREQALALPEGCSTRGTCPECDSTSAFSMTRSSGEVAYICFSASCTCRGVITSRHNSLLPTDQKVIRPRKLFNGTLDSLTEYERDYLSKTFRIGTEWLASVRYSEQDDRVYYPQLDVTGRIHGYIARYYPALFYDMPCKGAKALWKQVLPSELGLCFPTMEVLKQVVSSKRVCVVEDYPSMLRINSQLGIPTCCLGGTNIYESHISTMLSLEVEELIIVLDADAVTKAVKLKRSLSLAFNNVTILPLLGSDPKDMGIEELNKTFEVIL